MNNFEIKGREQIGNSEPWSRRRFIVGAGAAMVIDSIGIKGEPAKISREQEEILLTGERLIGEARTGNYSIADSVQEQIGNNLIAKRSREFGPISLAHKGDYGNGRMVMSAVRLAESRGVRLFTYNGRQSYGPMSSNGDVILLNRHYLSQQSDLHLAINLLHELGHIVAFHPAIREVIRDKHGDRIVTVFVNPVLEHQADVGITNLAPEITIPDVVGWIHTLPRKFNGSFLEANFRVAALGRGSLDLSKSQIGR